ncbi:MULTISPECIES: TfoX/Sxy family protein [unclassified Microbulbifer]|uniref:TfoX/Sxy family protein n=1 Tax=Microbulbifer spongiae TaxID=2944933 RepID=A0ABY9E757_9GAMM|nr:MULTISPECIES: TfoX/Sxy family protein [unclassified Microbulbifer]MDP5209153.1 TfoX/Sxy family protein [Microbulbifer sp. 2205BS26-8]WKD48848.1 TfoX/Sxy family protein [Microbulbifer sp. MI-G]
MHPSQSELLKLKNLGLASVNILHSIGIRSYDDLHRIGPVEAFISIRNRGINASRVMLYALQGALMDVHWNDLDPNLKQQLASEVDRLLATQNPE